MSVFSSYTQPIVNAHKADFNCTNFSSKLKSYGGYNAYLKKLGGVFAEYAGKSVNAKTVAQFQYGSEYVFGLFSIYGFDYSNGNSSKSTYHRWGGGSPFYVDGKKGKCNWGTIDALCSTTAKSKTTNCNYGIDSLMYKLGLMGGSGQVKNSDAFKKAVNTNKCKVIRNKKDLRVGDLVHMFHSKVTSSNPSTWKGWGHVVVVGEITDDSIIMYDTGSRYIKSGNFKQKISKSGSALGGTYANYAGWAAIRVCSLKDMLGKRTNADLAVEVIHDKYKGGTDRMKALGCRYDAVQKLVNEYLTPAGHAAYIKACAQYVWHDFDAGSDEQRMKYFGDLYDEVQAEVNKGKK